MATFKFNTYRSYVKKCFLTLQTLLLIILSLFSSCSYDKNNDVQYIPFQEKENGEWGMMSPDGKVLFSPQFKNCPSYAYEDRFWVMNESGYYELFTTEEQPKRVGEEYRYVSDFYDGRAFVAPRDKHISIIDRDAKELLSLEKIGNYTPVSLHNISEGMAIFTVDTVMGAVNLNGDLIIKPEHFSIGAFHSGMAIAMPRDYNPMLYTDSIMKTYPKANALVFNKQGEKVLEISNQKYPLIGLRFYGDYLPVGKYINEKPAWGIINSKGEEIIAPNAKYTQISEISENSFIYTSEKDKMGLKNINGEEMIRDRYAYLHFASSTRLVAITEMDDSEEGNDPLYSLISIDDKKLTSKDYIFISTLYPNAYKFAVAQLGENRWSIINDEGQRVETGIDVSGFPYVNILEGTMIVSDFIDIPSFVSSLGISEEGTDSLTFKSSVNQTLERQSRYFSWLNKPKASDYTKTSVVFISRSLEGEQFDEQIIFPSTLSKQNYRKEMVIDYVDYYWNRYWYHYENRPTGITFQKISPSVFQLTFNNQGKLRGKLFDLYKELVINFSAMGKLNKERKGFVLYDLPNGKQAIVVMKGTEVVVAWGKLSKDHLQLEYESTPKEDLSKTIEQEGD